MEKSTFIFFVLLSLIVGASIGYYFGYDHGFERTFRTPGDEVIVSGEIAIFTGKIQDYVIENIGQPIEGFNADIYLLAFPGLMEVDFNLVETSEGIYKYSDNELIFMRREVEFITSAEEMILDKGHKTLFENVRDRLDNDLSVDEIITNLITP